MIITDCESSGLRPGFDIAVEVAWCDLLDGRGGVFVPEHDTKWVLHNAEPKALEINGYRERILHAKQDDGTEVQRLYDTLKGRTMAGSNPAVDARWLEELFQSQAKLDVSLMIPAQPWHYRLEDLSVAAKYTLGLAYLPGLLDVCKMLGVQPGDHSAWGDVVATARCFDKLYRRAGIEADWVVP